MIKLILFLDSCVIGVYKGIFTFCLVYKDLSYFLFEGGIIFFKMWMILIFVYILSKF